MKIVFAFLFLILHLSCYTQDTIVKPESIDLRTFINGFEHQDSIDIQLLQTGFKLSAADSAMRIKSFDVSLFQDDATYYRHVEGDCLPAHLFRDNLDTIDPFILCTIDNVLASDGKQDFKVSGFVVTAYDQYKRYPGIFNPVICFNQKKQLACYNDGTYLVYTARNRIAGFKTVDSLVQYDVQKKVFRIRKSFNENERGKIVGIQLNKKSVSFRSNQGEKLLETISDTTFVLDGIRFDISGKNNFDTIRFSSGGKDFSINFWTWGKNWSWDVSEKHEGRLMLVSYLNKKHRAQWIGVFDDRFNYQMSLASRFHSHKQVWIFESYFYDEYPYEDIFLKRINVQKPGYYYSYDRFGRLRNKQTKGAVKLCSCF